MASEESKLQREILEALDKHPAVVWGYITTSGLMRSYRGNTKIQTKPINKDDVLLDILGQLKDGRLFSIEVKTPGNNPTEDQHKMIDKINSAGGVAGWTTNVIGAFSIINEAS